MVSLVRDGGKENVEEGKEKRREEKGRTDGRVINIS